MFDKIASGWIWTRFILCPKWPLIQLCQIRFIHTRCCGQRIQQWTVSDCVNTELRIVLSLQGNPNVHCGIRTSVNQLQRHHPSDTNKTFFSIGPRVPLELRDFYGFFAKWIWMEENWSRSSEQGSTHPFCCFVNKQKIFYAASQWMEEGNKMQILWF